MSVLYETKPLSIQEKEVFDHVVSSLNNHVIDEIYLIQFVRGYSHEKEWKKTVLEMITKALEWREKLHTNNIKINNICNVKLDKRDLFKNTWITHVTGKDKNGRFITVDRIGKINTTNLLEKFSSEELFLNHIQTQEFITKIKGSDKLIKNISILDLSGINTSHMNKKFTNAAKSLIDFDQWFYPEGLEKMYLVNVPIAFRALWSIVNPWINSKTKSKIHICGNDFLNELTSHGIEKDQLPDFLGGTAIDLLDIFEKNHLLNITSSSDI